MQNNITGLLLDLDELDFAVILRKLKDFFVKWLERAERQEGRPKRGGARDVELSLRNLIPVHDLCCVLTRWDKAL